MHFYAQNWLTVKAVGGLLILSTFVAHTSQANDLIQRISGGRKCADTFSGRSISPLAEVINIFRFPEEGDYPVSDKVMRKAIYKTFNGKDFYTGREINIEEMVIDHVIPKALGGPDNVFNYVPTTSRINGAKSDSFDEIGAIGTLSALRIIYAPKVLREIERSQISTPQKRVKIGGTASNNRIYRPRPETKLTRQEYGVRFGLSSSHETITRIHELVLANRAAFSLQDGFAEISLDLTVWKQAFPEGIQSLITSLEAISTVRTDIYSSGRKVEEVEQSFLLGFGRSGIENLIPNTQGIFRIRFEPRIGKMFDSYDIEHLQSIISIGPFLSVTGDW